MTYFLYQVNESSIIHSHTEAQPLNSLVSCPDRHTPLLSITLCIYYNFFSRCSSRPSIFHRLSLLLPSHLHILMGSPAHVVLTNHDTSCLPPYRQSHRLRFHPYARYAPSPVAAAEEREAVTTEGELGFGVSSMPGNDSLPAFWRRKLNLALSNLSKALHGHSDQSRTLDLTELTLNLAFTVRAARQTLRAV
ncbi:hypothetical protein CERSUDRAFT_113423 [Gelatoporia subvermispora B]|uniref:Uncharacterized protein n=1 Tax=Ceriporiopsis subvermispora (strain B) TaxID=914234 RepID=M2PP63_CERS8|nr:hypothetical protein CERSUDRAFT_113423 [Gelatoporia subvermispora B]